MPTRVLDNDEVDDVSLRKMEEEDSEGDKRKALTRQRTGALRETDCHSDATASGDEQAVSNKVKGQGCTNDGRVIV
jgi:hypothetical protein